MGTSKSTEKNEVQQFLAEMNLEKYYQKFSADGWTTMEVLKHITEKDLVESIGMKRGFALQVLIKINKMQPQKAEQEHNMESKIESGLTNTINEITIARTEQLEILKSKSSDKFILRNAITQGITRLSVQREMIIGLFDKHMFSHSKFCVVYFSRIAAGVGDIKEEEDETADDIEGIPLGKAITGLLHSKSMVMAPRLFQFELFINENKENILSITGPEKLPG
eukprot:461679_1